MGTKIWEADIIFGKDIAQLSQCSWGVLSYGSDIYIYKNLLWNLSSMKCLAHPNLALFIWTSFIINNLIIQWSITFDKLK